MSNLELVHSLIEVLAKHLNVNPETYRNLIRFVADRPGHDFRYAIDGAKMQEQLSWQPRWSWSQGLKKTVQWYVKNL